ncbi:hypothetical protein GXW82_26510 [Streptacidiphilus sp. 4-A2]|nr:hypothetical protein [Streptacidiphilus sp. 4-A2]
MRHTPTAPARLRPAILLASLLFVWSSTQLPSTAAQPPHSARSPRPHAGLHNVPASTLRPGGAEDHSSALIPIAIGLALTGIASYKHRGLPRGH